MRTLCTIFFLLISLPLTGMGKEQDAHYVTYEFSGGRFGDNLLTYLHAKWISYKYRIPLLYKPFDYSSELALHDLEIPYKEDGRQWKRKIRFCDVTTKEQASNPKRGSSVYLVGYFSEFPNELATEEIFRKYYFFVDWQDEGFLEFIKPFIKTKTTLPSLDLPKDIPTVAVHMRTGIGKDSEHTINTALFKIPPKNFYVDALKTLYNMLQKSALHVQVFTDDPDPAACVEKLKTDLAQSNVTFGYRAQGNRHDVHVLEDFFSMMECDYLIRPESNYSYIASKIHRYNAVLCPQSVVSKNGCFVVDILRVELPDSEFKVRLY